MVEWVFNSFASLKCESKCTSEAVGEMTPRESLGKFALAECVHSFKVFTVYVFGHGKNKVFHFAKRRELFRIDEAFSWNTFFNAFGTMVDWDTASANTIADFFAHISWLMNIVFIAKGKAIVSHDRNFADVAGCRCYPPIDVAKV